MCGSQFESCISCIVDVRNSQRYPSKRWRRKCIESRGVLKKLILVSISNVRDEQDVWKGKEILRRIRNGLNTSFQARYEDLKTILILNKVMKEESLKVGRETFGK